MKEVSRKNFPHLTGAILMEGRAGTGLCIHRAAAFVLDRPGADLCFGIFPAATEEEKAAIPNASDVSFIHAWAELSGMVYAPTTIERTGGVLAPMRREGYYSINRVIRVKRLSRRQLLQISGQIGLSAHLRHGKPTRGGASVGGTLLDAAGVAWRETEDGGLVPAEPNGEESTTG